MSNKTELLGAIRKSELTAADLTEMAAEKEAVEDFTNFFINDLTVKQMRKFLPILSRLLDTVSAKENRKNDQID